MGKILAESRTIRGFEDKIMQDFDSDKHGMRFCAKAGCNACHGVDQNGEPNGYGCTSQDKYTDERYRSILKRRLKKQRAD